MARDSGSTGPAGRVRGETGLVVLLSREVDPEDEGGRVKGGRWDGAGFGVAPARAGDGHWQRACGGSPKESLTSDQQWPHPWPRLPARRSGTASPPWKSRKRREERLPAGRERGGTGRAWRSEVEDSKMRRGGGAPLPKNQLQIKTTIRQGTAEQDRSAAAEPVALGCRRCDAAD